MPRTEAGKRWMQKPAAQVVTGMSEAIEAIEDEAEHRGYLRANDCDHSPCIEREAEAVAAERERIRAAVNAMPWYANAGATVDVVEVLAIVNPAADR
jgi:hypothetical protein